MSALSYQQIITYLQAEAEDRLVISPLLQPKKQLARNQAAVDVRLGRVFSLVTPWTRGVAEVIDRTQTVQEPVLDTFVLAFGQPLIIHPHQFVLARTMEIVRLPRTLLAYVIGRSSWGRRGLTVATAVEVHPGFSGPITLELKNVGEIPIAIYPCDRVAQLAFHEVGAGAAQADISKHSQFASTYVPGLGKVRDDQSENRIREMVEEREEAIRKLDKGLPPPAVGRAGKLDN